MLFKYPYVCSLSDMVRAAVNLLGVQVSTRKIVEGVLEEIHEKGISDSLKVPFDSLRTARQCDIRQSPNGTIIYKIFVTWDQENERWHVYVEGGEETIWEKRFQVQSVDAN